jgi:hypothetical protein
MPRRRTRLMGLIAQCVCSIMNLLLLPVLVGAIDGEPSLAVEK